MKKTILAIALILTGIANSQTSYTYGTDGITSHTKSGDYTYTNRPSGVNEISNKIGDYTYTNRSNGINSVDNTIGNTTYRNNSDGTSSTATQVGNATYINNGTRTVICTHNGNTTYCN